MRGAGRSPSSSAWSLSFPCFHLCFGNRESGIGNRESGIGNRESGIEIGAGIRFPIPHSPFPLLGFDAYRVRQLPHAGDVVARKGGELFRAARDRLRAEL